MRTIRTLLLIAALLAPASGARSQTESGNHSFAFGAVRVAGFPTGEVMLTGGGSYDPSWGFLKAGGGFRCTRDVGQGPLAGCRTGEGVRWDAAQILPSTGFKCTGSDAELLKTAVTGGDVVVMQARFFRHGDGAQASFTARMFVSAGDLDPIEPGIQNVWIQGVGCGDAGSNFR